MLQSSISLNEPLLFSHLCHPSLVPVITSYSNLQIFIYAAFSKTSTHVFLSLAYLSFFELISFINTCTLPGLKVQRLYPHFILPHLLSSFVVYPTYYNFSHVYSCSSVAYLFLTICSLVNSEPCLFLTCTSAAEC